MTRGELKLLFDIRRGVLCSRLRLFRENGRSIMARRYVAKLEELDYLAGILGIKDDE